MFSADCEFWASSISILIVCAMCPLSDILAQGTAFKLT